MKSCLPQWTTRFVLNLATLRAQAHASHVAPFKVRVNLPQEHERLEELIECLPLCASPISRPCSGYVYNVHASLDAHRDGMDTVMCFVIPFGEWEGAELVIYELGLVFELSSGDLTAFRSDALTHFNKEIRGGTRGSFAIQTDSHLNRWKDGRNEWTSVQGFRRARQELD